MSSQPAYSVITISRQMGSQGEEVARLVGQSLGYRVVSRELINQAAIQTGSPEIALAAIDELGLLGICPSLEACTAYREQIALIMDDLAAAGKVVIVGRAGMVILANRPEVFHVQVIAPAELRTKRVANAQHISQECAQHQIEASDRFRRLYIKNHYQARWDNPTLFDLVVNTAHVSIHAAVCMIVAGVERVDEALGS
jgi:cytidylate kinase